MRVLGVTLGDERGIGPEVVFKALATGEQVPEEALVLIGRAPTIERYAERYGLKPGIPEWPGRSKAIPGLWRIEAEGIERIRGTVEESTNPARDAVNALSTGSRLALAGEIEGLVTGPVNKAAINKAGIPFVGQTEWLTGLAGGPKTGMVLLGTDDHGRWLRVLLATTHIPLAAVPRSITTQGLMDSMSLAQRACRELGLETERIAVTGLNPHAGEEGQIGLEEQEIITPAIQRAQAKGMIVSGPWPGDTIFREAIQGRHDIILAMYHDQGLAPLKLVAFETGVNWTVGLPYPRTSPDHGTAMDIAGRGIADPTSMRNAIQMARRLVARRSHQG